MAYTGFLWICLLGCLFSGGYGAFSEWRELNGTEYYLTEYANEVHTWQKGRQFCMDLGGDLASIHSQEVLDQLMVWSDEKRYYNYDYWTGFNNLDREGFRWVDDSAVDFKSWAPSFPETENYGHFCAYIKAHTAGDWYNDQCAKDRGVMCQRPVTSSSPTPKTDPPTIPPGQMGYCPKGFVDAGTKCFKVVPLLEEYGVTFEEAIGRCRLEPGRLTDIASIHSSYENAIITSQMQRYYDVGLWIGLYQATGRTWYWADNSEVDFTYWEKGQPDRYKGDCAVMVYRHPPMGHTGMWNNTNGGDCKVKKGYVCQAFKDPGNIITTPPSTTTNICPANSVPFDKSCFRFVTEAKSWAEANKTCHQDGSNLVSVHNDAENAFLFTLKTQLTPGQDVWTGLYDNQEDGVYHWSDGWYVMYTHWAKDQPKRQEGGGCVAMAAEGMWYDRTCTTPKAFICETTRAPPVTTPIHSPGKCPNQEDWVGWGDYCYSFVGGDRGDWFTAQDKCRKKHASAQLVSIHDEVENDVLYKHMLPNAPYNDVWIGLYRSQSDGEFKWVDRTLLQYQHWRPGSPRPADGENHCVQMSMRTYPKMWEDVKCTGYMGFICKTMKRPLPTTPPNLPGKCPGDLWVPYGSHCYLLEPDSFTSWDAAQRECARYGGEDAMLASIGEEHENDFIYKAMYDLSDMPRKRDYWLGGKKDGVGSAYYWVDGQPFSYNGWAVGYPGSDPNGIINCMVTDMASGTWINKGCDNIYGYICKVKKEVETPTTSAYYNDTSSTMTTGSDDVATVATSPPLQPSQSGTVAAIILGVILALVLIVNISVCFLRSGKAPKTIVGFNNPLASNSSQTGSQYASWTASGRHGSSASGRGGKVKTGLQEYENVA